MKQNKIVHVMKNLKDESVFQTLTFPIRIKLQIVYSMLPFERRKDRGKVWI